MEMGGEMFTTVQSGGGPTIGFPRVGYSNNHVLQK